MTGRVLFFVALLAGSVSAQLGSEPTIRRITIRLVSPNGSGCDATTRVTLAGIQGPAVGGSPNSNCEVEFSGIPVGTYHVTVSGLHFATVDTGNVSFDSAGPHELEVRVGGGGQGAPMVSRLLLS